MEEQYKYHGSRRQQVPYKHFRIYLTISLLRSGDVGI